MNRKRRLKRIIIAVGILISAAFYVQSAGGAQVSDADGSGQLVISSWRGETMRADAVQRTSATGEDASSGGMQEVNNAYGNAYAEMNAEMNADMYAGNVQDAYMRVENVQDAYMQRMEEMVRRAVADTLRETVRGAVREEMMALSEEGYLETALAETARAAAAEEERQKGLVDINHADLYELTKLDGIGEKRARDILSYRETHGGFQDAEEIQKVDGIGEAVYRKLKDKIYAGHA